MSFFKIIKNIITHPLNKEFKTKSILIFIKWQLNNLLNKFPIIYSFTDRSEIIIAKGMTGATGNLYCGLHEFHDMAFLLHFLRKDDLFVDIGANVGSYTVLSSAHVGAKTLAFEPVKKTFSLLEKNIDLNAIRGRVEVRNIALGSSKGRIRFTTSLDTMNHVAMENDLESEEVEVDRLDQVLIDRNPVLMKIDVEGFETEVLAGSPLALKNESLKAIIIELNGSGTRYGYDELKIHETLVTCGFSPYSYDPFKRTISEVKKIGSHNTIYIRDIFAVELRLKSAEVVSIRGVKF